MSHSKPSVLSGALDHEQFGLDFTAERLGPNGVSIIYDIMDIMHKNTLLYLRIEALRAR